MTLLHIPTLDSLIDTVGLATCQEIAVALQTTLKQFQADYPQMDHESMGNCAHTLKGSTSYLGTDDLHQAAVQADRAYKDGGDMTVALGRLNDLIDPSLEALQQELDRRQ